MDLEEILNIQRKEKYNRKNPDKGFKGQYKQDEYVYNNFFAGQKNGTFLDVGAHDGISLNNTFFFEKMLGWKGICFEPNPDVFSILKLNRTAICLPIALSNVEGIAEFTKITGYSQTLSGLTKEYHPNYTDRIKEEAEEFKCNAEIINIKTRTLNSVLEEYNFTNIDFMSLDTEGSELKVLTGLDFNKFAVRVIAMENNYDSQDHRLFMKERGYYLKERIAIDDIYVKA